MKLLQQRHSDLSLKETQVSHATVYMRSVSIFHSSRVMSFFLSCFYFLIIIYLLSPIPFTAHSHFMPSNCPLLFLLNFVVIYFLFIFFYLFKFSERTNVLWENYYSQYGSQEALQEKLYPTATALSFNIMIIHSNRLYHQFSSNNYPMTSCLNLPHKEKQPLT